MMMKRIDSRFVATGALVLLLGMLVASGCARKGSDDGSFDSAEAAAAALIAAFEANDAARFQRLLGPGSEDLLSSGDAVQDKGDRAEFVAAYGKSHKLVVDGDATTLLLGENDWPFPIPLVKRDGRWTFDAAKGADELVYRRIGRNELGAIAVCRGFVDAQREYAAEGRDGDAAGIYALKLVSDDGMHNGLYWPTAEGEDPSPAGPFVAAATGDGYRAGAGTPYHGYFYRPLFKQGEHANGGAREYFKDGLLTQGFALVAWPAQYQVSGVMTFIVDQDGVVFQKDLGEDTETAVDAMDAFDPDSSWTALTEPTT